MRKPLFYRFGKLINALRWPIICLWVIAILACIPIIPHIMAPFKSTGFIDEHSASTQAENNLNATLGYNNKNKLLIIYHSKTLLATNPLFKKKIQWSLADLEDFPMKHDVIFPDPSVQKSKDKHTAYAVIILKTNKPISDDLLKQFKKLIKKPAKMSVIFGGEPMFVDSVNQQTQTDLYKADFIATPIAIITLLIVFGSVIAATLPIILGGGCALIILTTLYFLGHLFTLSIFTINIALLLGLCLCLDYSLFYINRFRDELAHGLSSSEAIAVTQATAGKAIFFSGLAVFVSLSALFLFPVNILFSVAVGGLSAVFFAVLVSSVFLPAILGVLKTKINWLSIRLFRSQKNQRSSWRWLAEKVVYRPWLFFFSILSILLVLGYPFLSAKFSISDYRIFPEKSQSRSFYDNYAEQFNIDELKPIILVVRTHTPILSRTNLSKIYDLVHQLKQNPRIKEIKGIINSKSSTTKSQYYALYHMKKNIPDNIKSLLDSTTSKYMTMINVVSKYPTNSAQTKKLIAQLRDMSLSKGLEIELMGTAVSNVDVLHSIYHMLPYAILWIMAFSYLILLILLRSLFLPFKAILMNLLSLCASYGALVLVFQDGYLSQILNFEPQGMLDISLLVIIFCALFGFSMDYEVFLLTRIKESHEMTHDNNKSIIFGIEKSSRIITSAALIVIVICASFLVADVLMVKAFGLGIAVAIFMDAFLIRSFLVPATMALFKKWNWYLPKWLDKILPKL